MLYMEVKMEKKKGNSKYCPEIVSAICSAIADGKSLSEIEKEGVIVNGALTRISKDSITAWKQQYAEFRRELSFARDASDIGLFDRIQELSNIDLADIAREVNKLQLDRPLKVQLFTQRCNQIKEHISNIKWRLKILKPEKYGDRILQDINYQEKIDNLSNEDLPKEILKVAGIAYSDIENILNNTKESDTKQ